MTSNYTEIEEKISNLQTLINSGTSEETIQSELNDLSTLLDTYENNSPTENTVADDLNFVLSKQSLSIEEREELLNTKVRQIEVASERNSQTKNMLTIFIIINVIVLLIFIGLIIIKAD